MGGVEGCADCKLVAQGWDGDGNEYVGNQRKGMEMHRDGMIMNMFQIIKGKVGNYIRKEWGCYKLATNMLATKEKGWKCVGMGW